MKTLLIGGTGLISAGIVKHLLARGAEVWMLNRGKRENTLPGSVKAIVGDRNDPAVLSDVAARKFDVVIDMFCFDPKQCQPTVDAFAGKTGHFIFCSTVCTYGVKVPGRVLVDEEFLQEPISGYGRNKVACEKIVLAAGEKGAFGASIVRPSSTYGPGSPLICQLEPDTSAWDRVLKGKPILIADGGMGLWVSTYRDDCGQLFALMAGEKKSFGQSYNATREINLTWRDTYGEIAKALGKKATVVSMPAEWIWKHDPQRFGLLREITAFHGAYTSDKGKRDFPAWTCDTSLEEGAKLTFADMHRRGAWKNSDDDALYESMVQKALAAGAPNFEVG